MSERDEFDRRPTPEAMLARIRDETTTGRGRLRVYLGMAPGVGKTYRMLEEGHRRFERGTDLVVGFVEPHGRRQTAALLDGLEIIPRRRVEHLGITVEEMDSEAIVQRHPTVALIDELAHTNVPGSPREKRWEDVELIRDEGIHVVSTLNVQHLESLADAVETITGAPVRERLPDEILAGADEIELVDMSPHALRQRMRHGNVYPPDRATIALDKFFTESNLTALRDLSLRFVAGQVDEQLEEIVAEQDRGTLPPVSERVLAVLDERAACRRAVRRGAALASALRAPFLAAAVQTPGIVETRDRFLDLQENVDYAVDLGAEIVQVEAANLAAGLEAIIKDRRVSHVFLLHHGSGGLDRFLRRPTADALLERVAGIEIHLVSDHD